MYRTIRKTVLILILILSVTLGILFSFTRSSSDAVKVTYIIGDGTITYDIFYDDDYFHTAGGEFNQSLATCSYGLAVSSKAYLPAKDDFSQQYKFAQDFLQQTGFQDIKYNDNYKQPSNYFSLSMIIGRKTLSIDGEDVTLLAITTKSGNYQLEWLNNVDVGFDGNTPDHHHKGFYNSALREYTYIQNYIKEMDISGRVKIWMAGYSRGAAVTNMTAGIIDYNIYQNGSGFEGVQMNYEDVYAYCFETPQGAYRGSGRSGIKDPRSEYYGNIFNLTDENDPVAMVTMTELGFTRYGKDLFYPNNLTDSDIDEINNDMYTKYTAQLPKYSVRTYYQNTFDPMFYDDEDNIPREYVNPNVGLFMREFMRMLVEDVPLTRKDYMKTYRIPIDALLQFAFNGQISGSSLLEISDILTILTDDNNTALLVYDVIHDDEAFVNDFSSFVEYYAETNGNNINAELLENLGIVLRLITKATAKDKSYLLSFLSSDNINSIMNAHGIVSSMPWCMALDPNYGSVDSKASLNDGRFRRIIISGASNIILKDDTGTVKASFTGGRPDNLNTSLTYGTFVNGAMVIYTPLDRTYTLEINEDTGFTVSADLYDPDWNIYSNYLTTDEKITVFQAETGDQS